MSILQPCSTGGAIGSVIHAAETETCRSHADTEAGGGSNGSFQGGPTGDSTVQPLSQPLFYEIGVAAIPDMLITLLILISSTKREATELESPDYLNRQTNHMIET